MLCGLVEIASCISDEVRLISGYASAVKALFEPGPAATDHGAGIATGDNNVLVRI